MRTTALPVALVAALALAACGDADPEGTATADAAPAADDAVVAAGDADEADEADEAADDGATTYPVTVTNCDREVVVEERPTRVVGIEGAAETAFALGMGEQVVAYLGSPPERMPADYRDQAEASNHLGSAFPPPSLDALVAEDPDLLLLYSLYEDAGISGERLDELGIPYLLLDEACPERTGPSTLEAYFDDVRDIATVLGDAGAAEELVAGWQERIDTATADGPDGTPGVFVQGAASPEEVFATASEALGTDLIRLAGGENVFADVEGAYFAPSWEEVAGAAPDVIVNGSGGGEESTQQLKDFLAGNAALADMPAVRDDRFVDLQYEQNVPGPRAVDGVVVIAEALAGDG